MEGFGALSSKLSTASSLDILHDLLYFVPSGLIIALQYLNISIYIRNTYICLFALPFQKYL